MQTSNDVPRTVQPDRADGPPMSNAGMPYMLGFGILFAAVVAAAVFYNATSDHPATATNAAATQHAGAPPSAAPASKTQ